MYIFSQFLYALEFTVAHILSLISVFSEQVHNSFQIRSSGDIDHHRRRCLLASKQFVSLTL